jgi:outer membrane receptor protein involved in Fe transport
VAPVTPLVKATGAEIGLRTAAIPNFQFATSLWTLRLDSELLFIGDGGITESTRPSARDGIELSAIWTPNDQLIVDADLAWTRSRFSDQNPAGDRVPNAVERVASVGLSYRHPAGWHLGARLRHLGPAALVEDNSVRADASTIINFDVGYQVTRGTTLSLALLNAFDARVDDITYFYESQLPGEPAPVADVHFHPVEPRQVRVSLQTRF